MLLAERSQGGLLLESFQLITAAAGRVLSGQPSPYLLQSLPSGAVPSAAVRRQMHDELFRYFLSVTYYIGQRWKQGQKQKALPYYDRPRSAILACVSQRQRDELEAPRGKDAPPRLSRPCALDRLAAQREHLRKLVSLEGVGRAIERSFGKVLVDMVLDGPPATPRLAERVAAFLAAFPPRRVMALSQAIPIPDVPGLLQNAPPFTLHGDARFLCGQQILGGDLPFGVAEACLPSPLGEWLRLVEQLERALADSLQQAYQQGQQAYQQASEALVPWGLALTAVGRAYLTDLIAALVGVSLPLVRLYDEPDAGGLIIQLASPPDKEHRIGEKFTYNAYIAVALYEALTGDVLPHVDNPPGDGYLPQPSRQSMEDSLGAKAFKSFHKFWSGARRDLSPGQIAPRQIEADLEKFYGAPILVPAPPSGKEKGKRTIGRPEQEDQSETLDKFAKRFKFYPSLGTAQQRSERQKRLGTKAQGRGGRAGEEEAEKPELWMQCGVFSSHVCLSVAKQLAAALSEATNVARIRRWVDDKNGEWKTAKQADSKYLLRVGSGSLRWGGNHLPHLEHRDGLTFDVTHYVDFIPWLVGKCGAESQQAQAKRGQEPAQEVFGVTRQVESLRKPRKVTAVLFQRSARHDVEQAMKRILAQLVSDRPANSDLDARALESLVGLPIHRDERMQADDGALHSNLVGHVALALAGVKKWIYASPAQHVLALRGILSAFAGDKTLDPVRRAVLGANFFFYPADHYNHWHVVFHDLTPSERDSHDSLNDWITAWVALGVDLRPIYDALNTRQVQNPGRYPDWPMGPSTVEKQRSSLVRRLERALKQSPSTRDETPLFASLKEAISQASYDQLPGIADPAAERRFKRNVCPQPPKEWEITPSDVEESNKLLPPTETTEQPK